MIQRLFSRQNRFTTIEDDCLYIAAQKIVKQYENEIPSVTPDRAKRLVSKIILSYRDELSDIGIAAPIPKTDEQLTQRLRAFGILGGLNSTSAMCFNAPEGLIGFSLRPPGYKHLKQWLEDPLLGKTAFSSILTIFNDISKNSSNTSVSEFINEVRNKIAVLPYDKLNIVRESPLTVIFLGLDNDFIGIKEGQLYIVSTTNQHDFLHPFEQSIKNKKIDAEPLHQLRAEIADFYRIAPDNLKPLFIACSVGTGIGKSYGSMQSYVNYTKEMFGDLFPLERIGKGGFMNYLFMTPQKAQIKINEKQLQTLQDKGIQLLSVVSIQDQSSPDFVDWLTGERNFEFYNRCFHEVGSQAKNCQILLLSLNDKIQQEASVNKKTPEDKETLTMLRKDISRLRYRFVTSLSDLCLTLVANHEDEEQMVELVRNGILAERQRLNQTGKLSWQTNKAGATFALIKRVLPFEVCKHIPSVLAMTSQKALQHAYHLKKKVNKSGYHRVSSPFDRLVGGKSDKMVAVGNQLGLPLSEKEDFLKNDYFNIEKDSPYLKRDVSFTVVVDELHVTYNRFQNSTIVGLIDKDTHLLHVLSTAGKFVERAERIKSATFSTTVPDENDPNWALKKELVTFYNVLENYVTEKCSFTFNTSGLDLLKQFTDDLGTFEVDGNDATTVTNITKNIFSFNVKNFTNLKELKSIHIETNFLTGAKRLYLHRVGADDTNPTLYDLYQLLIALIAAGTQIKDKAFLDWIKTGNHSQEGHHHVFYDFIRKLHGISKEVEHILDLPDQGDLDVDFLYSYFQPKIIFSMQPIEKLSGYIFKNKEGTIYLSFEMSMIKASPEVSFLNMLAGTKNRVLPLSATSGFHRLYDSNYSTIFMRRMCRLLNVEYIQRDEKNLEKIATLRDERAKHRTVEFNIIKEDSLWFADYSPKAAEKARSIEQKIRSILSKDSSSKDSSKEAYFPSIFKKREVCRQISVLIRCYENRQNGISLAISHDFQNMLQEAIHKHPQYFKDNLGIEPVFSDKSTSKPKILSMDLYDEGHNLIIILFDGKLVELLESEPNHSFDDFVTIKDEKTNIALISSFGSAGTGLNNVVTNKYKELILDEDYQNIFICGSPHFSNVKGKGEGFETLYNHAIFLKNVADERRSVLKMSELPKNLSEDHPGEVLENEHRWAKVKELIQSIGRGERRDSILDTIIHIPDDVIAESAFVFKDFVQETKRNRNLPVYSGMSLLGKSFADFSVSHMTDRSFTEASARENFERKTQENGAAINHSHMSELRQKIRQYKLTGDKNSLKLNEALRSTNSFTNPEKWISQLNSACSNANAENMQVTLDKFFIDREDLSTSFVLCKKSTAKDDYTLTDYVGGRSRYLPWDMIFPRYSSDYSEADSIVKKIQKEFDGYKEQLLKNATIPNPAIIPLLRGNVGEYVFLKVMKSIGYTPLSVQEVRKILGTVVYEVFDFYFIVGTTLFCVDAKFWSTRRRNPEFVDKVRGNRNYKPQTVLDAVDNCSSDKTISKVSFLYINSFYGDTFYKENHSEMNHDSTIGYLNLFKKVSSYEQVTVEKENETTGKKNKQVQQIMKEKVCINPTLSGLFQSANI